MLGEHQDEIRMVRENHPQWFEFYEDHDPDICDRATLLRLIETAPTTYIKGFCMGKLSLRVQLSMISGRSFC
jgi:hypothetical protein